VVVESPTEIDLLIKIKEFQWDKGNEKHVRERHNVAKFEAEEVFIGDPYFRVGRDGTRYVYGQTSSGQYLFVVCISGKELLGWSLREI